MKETRFKQTEVGLIPEDWDFYSLKQIGKFSKGAGINRNESSTGNIPAIRYGEIYTHHNNTIREFISWISSDVAKKSKKIEFGDILFTASGETKEDIGKCVAYTLPYDAYAGGDIIILSPNSDYDPLFLGYSLNSGFVCQQKASKGQGDAIVHITSNSLSKIFCIAPDKNEQSKIASALFSIDNLLLSLDKLIQKKKFIKQGAMQELLTGKKRLSGFTKEWVVKKLGEVATFVNGNGFPLIYQGFKHGAYPFYKVSDLSSKGNERKMYKANNYVDDQIVKKIYCNIIPEKSVIFAKIGAAIFLERKRLTTCKCCIDNNMMAMIMHGDIDCLFMLYYLESISLSNISNATALPSIRAKDIAEIILRFPSNRLEQEAIASILESMDKEIESLETKKAKYEQIKQGMIQQLLTGKIRLTVI